MACRIDPCKILGKIISVAILGFLIVIALLCGYTAYDTTRVNQESSAGVYSNQQSTCLGNAYQKISATNDDVVGWIHLDDTGVSQPIVQGADNSFYLSHDARGNDSFGGACFLDSRADSGLESGVPVIFGHNMTGNAMFGDIAAYAATKDYLSNHQTGCLCKAGSWYKINALCALVCSESDRAIYDCLGDGEKGLFCSACRQFSVADIRMPQQDEHLLALSTCSQNGSKRCVLVLAVGDEMPSLASTPLSL